jgi:hypothetical protein
MPIGFETYRCQCPLVNHSCQAQERKLSEREVTGSSIRAEISIQIKFGLNATHTLFDVCSAVQHPYIFLLVQKIKIVSQAVGRQAHRFGQKCSDLFLLMRHVAGNKFEVINMCAGAIIVANALISQSHRDVAFVTQFESKSATYHRQCQYLLSRSIQSPLGCDKIR